MVSSLIDSTNDHLSWYKGSSNNSGCKCANKASYLQAKEQGGWKLSCLCTYLLLSTFCVHFILDPGNKSYLGTKKARVKKSIWLLHQTKAYILFFWTSYRQSSSRTPAASSWRYTIPELNCTYLNGLAAHQLGESRQLTWRLLVLFWKRCLWVWPLEDFFQDKPLAWLLNIP